MASSLALKRLVASNLFAKSLRPVTASSHQSTSRLFNTNALRDYEDNDPSSERDVSSCRDFPPNLFSDVFDPFATTRSLSQILNLMDRLIDSPLLSRPRGGIGGGIRRDWEAKETADGMYLRMDMPGLGKEDVKVSVEQNTLIIKGEVEKESAEDEDVGRRRYSSRIDLPEKVYKTDEIKAEMKNGVLKVLVPRVKDGERSDVFHVTVD